MTNCRRTAVLCSFIAVRYIILYTGEYFVFYDFWNVDFPVKPQRVEKPPSFGYRRLNRRRHSRPKAEPHTLSRAVTRSERPRDDKDEKFLLPARHEPDLYKYRCCTVSTNCFSTNSHRKTILIASRKVRPHVITVIYIHSNNKRGTPQPVLRFHEIQRAYKRIF